MNDQVTREETSALLRLAEQALAAEGDFVELGCYRGDTSVLLGQLLQKTAAKRQSSPVENPVEKTVENSQTTTPQTLNLQPSTPSKCLWLYDSFAGLPEKTREDASGAGANFQAGELSVTKREVVDKLRKHGLKVTSNPHSTSPDAPSIIVKKAWFSDLTDQDLPRRIAFAFCDGDLYQSIKTSLQLVVPRLSEQGIIVIHDYDNPELPGSSRAVDEFLHAHPEFHLSRRHSLAILTRRLAKPNPGTPLKSLPKSPKQ